MNTGARGTTAAVLAGGLGTRLRPVIGKHAKVLAHVSGRPFLSFVLDQLESVGIRRTVLCVGYRAREILDIYGDRFGSMRIEYSLERRPLGTGGALRHALPRLDSPAVLVLNGDTFYTGDLGEILRFHDHHRGSCTVALSHRESTAAFGRVRLTGHESVVAFEEKGEADDPGWVNAGVYVMDRGFIAGIPGGRKTSLENEVLPACAGHYLMGYRSQADFLDMGTPEGLRRADAYLTSLDNDQRKAVGHGH